MTAGNEYKNRRTVWAVLLMAVLCMGLLAGCGQKADTADGGAPEIEGLTFDHEMELAYADQFHVYYYNDDYEVITVEGGEDYMLIPEGGEIPDGTRWMRWIPLHSPVQRRMTGTSKRRQPR